MTVVVPSQVEVNGVDERRGATLRLVEVGHLLRLIKIKQVEMDTIRGSGREQG